MDNNKVYEGLNSIYQGHIKLRNALKYVNSLGWDSEDVDRLVSLLNEDMIVANAYRKCYYTSLDNSYLDVFCELWVEKHTDKSVGVVTHRDNAVAEVIEALDKLVYGAEIVKEEAKKNKELRYKLRMGVYSSDLEMYIISPFKEFGISGWYNGLRSFRKAFKSRIKGSVGRYQYEKIRKSIN